MSESTIIWRIDDRLIHGQIIVGWSHQLPIKKILVCDDQIAASEWEKQLLLMAAPPQLPAICLSAQETVRQLPDLVPANGDLLVLMKYPSVLNELMNRGVQISEVNVGGIHFQEGREQYLSYLYLSDEDISIFRSLWERGVHFECKDLPNSQGYDLRKIVEKRK